MYQWYILLIVTHINGVENFLEYKRNGDIFIIYFRSLLPHYLHSFRIIHFKFETSILSFEKVENWGGLWSYPNPSEFTLFSYWMVWESLKVSFFSNLAKINCDWPITANHSCFLEKQITSNYKPKGSIEQF